MTNLLMVFPMWVLTFTGDPNKSVSLTNSLCMGICAACQEEKRNKLSQDMTQIVYDMEEQQFS